MSDIDPLPLKPAEGTLQAELDKFRLIVERAGQGIAIIQKGRIKFANPWFCRLAGCTEQELLNSPILDFIHPDARDMVANYHVRRCAGEDVPERYELKGLAKSGRVVWLEISGVRIEWEGEPATLNYFTDISERRKAEADLRNTLAATNDGIWDYNLITDGFTCSDRWATMLGYEPGELQLKGCYCRQIIHPEDLPVLEQTLGDYLAGKSPAYAMEFRLKTKEGGYKWIYSRGRIVERDEKGNPVRIVGAHTDIDARKRAELDNQVLKDRLQGMFDHLSIGVAVYEAVERGRDFTFIDFNRAAESITRVTREKVVGHTLLECFPNMDRSGLLEAMRTAWKTGTCQHLKPFYYSDEQRSGWRENRIFRIPSGEVVVLFEDVTRRVQDLESLRESEERFRVVFESVADNVFLKDLELRYRMVNPVVERLLGRSHEDLIGRPDGELFDPDVAQQLEKSDRRVLAGEIVEDELAISVQGSSRFFNVKKTPVRGADGSVVGLCGVARDITEKKRSEEALREVAEELDATIEASMVGLMFLKNRVITKVNERMGEMLGYTPEEIEGQGPEQLHLSHDHFVEFGEKYYWRLAEKAVVQIEFPMRHKDGHVVWGLFSGRAVAPPDLGRGAVWAVDDITERKEAEAEKERLEAQLQQSQKLESIGRLAGGVAHDLNNLLSPILGYAEMLLQDAARNDPRRDSLDQIVKAGNRARDLVRQLLAFSRKQTLEFKSVDLNQLIRGFQKLLHRTMRENISIRPLLDESLPRIMGDVGQLEQVIMNLAVNSQDAIAGEGILTLETRKEHLEKQEMEDHTVVSGEYAVLVVRDTGCGMDEETRRHIFEPFYTTKGRDKGTGLGLSTVYGIVKQHKGYIDVHSEPDKGTEFTIFFPAFEGDVAEEEPISHETDATGTETILFAEDNRQVRELTTTILKREGYRVLAAESGEQALELLKGHEGAVALLLTDVIMSGMNGRELADRVRTISPETRILFMSGYTDDTIAEHGVIKEGIMFLHKPFSVKVLLAKVREAMDAHDEAQ
jgi:PAS domain S-box-containing protein